MHLTTVFLSILTTIAVIDAQATFNSTGDSFSCPSANRSYCAGASLRINIIIRCTGMVGLPGNCDDNLAGVDPVGVKTFAPCYQSTPSAGDAACSFDGIVYGLNGTFPVPGSSNSTNTTASTMTTSRRSNFSMTVRSLTSTSTTLMYANLSSVAAVPAAASSSGASAGGSYSANVAGNGSTAGAGATAAASTGKGTVQEIATFTGEARAMAKGVWALRAGLFAAAAFL